ncbi:hypothetical protein KQH82_08660 [bacterium]|nr:hypothetical protein [bacterium]
MIFTVLVTVGLVAGSAPAPHARVVRLAVVQGGDYAGHAVLSQSILTEVRRLLPDTIEVVTPPDAYVNGGWNIERFREQMAALAASDRADIALAIGPWSVEALLNAGWEKPIAAAFRLDPVAEGLLDSAMHPVAPNLGVTAFPNRYYNDFLDMKRLLTVDTLAVLRFESSPGDTALPNGMLQAAEGLGIMLIPVRGYTPRGEYAFFKAYQQVPKSADALYVSPLWGLQADAIKQFLALAVRDRRPVIASDGAYLVERGALVSGAGRSSAAEAMIVASKLAKIVTGAVPADLQVAYPEVRGLTLNEATAEKCGISINDRLRGEAAVFSEVARGDAYDLSLAISTAVSRAGKAPADSVERAVTEVYLRLVQSEFAVEIARAALAALDGFYERAYGAVQADLIDQRELKRLRAERARLEAAMSAVLLERSEAGAVLAQALSFASAHPLHIDTSAYSEHALMSAYHQIADSLSNRVVRERLLERLMAAARSAGRQGSGGDESGTGLHTKLLRISEKLQAAPSFYDAQHEAQNVLLMLAERPSSSAHDAIDAVTLYRTTRMAVLRNRLAFFRECAELASAMGWKSEGNWRAPVNRLIAAIQSGAGEDRGQ